MKLKITRKASGWYTTNAQANNDLLPMTIEIYRSIDNKSLWIVQPLEKGLKSKREAISILEKAIKSVIYNGYSVTYK